MAYCMAPYRNLHIQNGIAKPCCWYNKKYINNTVDKLADSADIFHSEEFDAIRINPQGCQTCQRHEAAGGKSHRMLWNEREQDTGEVKLTDLDLYMGNLCNLACVTCDSHNSTKWIAEEKKLWGKAGTNKQKDTDITLSYELVKNVKRIKLAGGEVTLMPHHDVFLQQLIDFGVAKNIKLVYIVNNTTDPTKFKSLFEQFESVEFILSVDGIGKVNDYVRYHSNWENNNTNIEKTIDMGIDVSINSVVSILNVYHLPDIIKWWKNRGKIFFRILDYPHHLSIKHLPTNMRQLCIDRFRDYAELDHVTTALYEYPNGSFENFEKWISVLDKNRNNSWWEINEQFR